MWWIVGIAGLSLASWGIVSTRAALYPDRRTPPIPHPAASFTTARLVARDGVPFEVWRFQTPSPRARVLICHGYYAYRYQVVDIAQGLRTRGYEIVLFELRGHGERPGPCTFGLKEAEDATTLLQWAKQLDHGVLLPVGVLGLSLGAAVVCHVASRESSVQAVVVDSIYSRLFPILQRALWQRYHLPTFPFAWVTWWGLQLALRRRLRSIDPVVLAPQLHQPLFAIQGGEDRRVVPMLAREFYQRWAGSKERWFEPRVAHVGMFTHNPQEYCDRVARFFDGVFKGMSAA